MSAVEHLQIENTFQQVLVNLATDFINCPVEQVDAAIVEAIRQVVELLGAIRAGIHQIDENRESFHTLYRWQVEDAPDVIWSAPIPNRQSTMDLLERGECITVSNREALQDSDELRHLMETIGTMALVAVPIRRGNRLFGFVSTGWRTSVNIPPETLHLLRIPGEIFLNAIERKHNEERIHKLNEDLERRVQERTNELRLANEQLQNEIREREQIESMLRASEERYRMISEVMSDYAFLYEVDPAGNMKLEWVTIDPYTRLTGYTLNDIKQPYRRYHPDDEQQAREDVQRTLKGEKVEREYRIMTKSGDLCWIYMRRYPVWDAQEQRVVRFYGVAQDINARKEAEEALRLSEERYRRITELISDFAFLYRSDPDGSLSLEWITEDSYQRVTGYTLSTSGESFRLYHPDDEPHAVQDIARTLEGEPNDGEYRIITRSGEERWLYIRRYPIWDTAHSRVERFYGVAQDITGRKQVAEALRRSEANFRATFEQAAVGIAHVSPDGHCLRVNQALGDILGYTTGELIGKTIQEITYPEDLDADLNYIDQMLSGAIQTYSMHKRYLHSSGSMVWGNLTVSLVRDAQGQPDYFVGMLEDINALKETGLALIQSEERYRVITELITDYAFLYRIGPDSTLVSEWVTEDSYKRVTGYDAYETGEAFRLYHPDDAPRVREDVQRTLHGQQTEGEYRIITHSGDVRWLHLRRYPLWDKPHEHVERYYGVAQDITARKQVEEALRLNEERYRIITELISDYAFLHRAGEDDAQHPEWITGDSYTRLTGFGPGETGGPYHLYHPDDADRAHQDVERTLQGQTTESEYRIITKSGEERWIFMRRYPLWDEAHQRVQAFYGVAQNITRRKLVEEALRVSEERYRRITELISDFAFLYSRDADGTEKIEWITEGPYYRLTGYTHAEMGLPIRLSHPDDKDRARQDVERALKGETVEAEYRIITKSGEIRWIFVRRYPVRDKPNEKIERFYGVAQDITGQKRIEAGEREQRTLAAALLDTARVLNSTLDLDEVLDRILANVERVVTHNEGAILLIEGSTARVVRAKGENTLRWKSEIESFRFSIDSTASLRQVYETGQPLVIGDVRHFPGWVIENFNQWIRCHACIPIQQDAKVIGFLTWDSAIPNSFAPEMLTGLQAFAHQTAIAITNARLYQQAGELATLEERQRLARDLHDAVTQTMFSASVIAETLPRLWEKNPEQVRQGLTQLHHLTRGAVAEMRSLLLELRPEALEGIGLPRLIGQLVDAFRGQTGIIPTFVSDEDRPLPYDVKVMLYRIAQEAFNNISKHARASEVNVNLVLNPVVKLTLEDNGRGFLPEQVKPGSLGLKIMRERAEQIGARFTVESESGHTTTITVEWDA